jgi:hypothetical protein
MSLHSSGSEVGIRAKKYCVGLYSADLPAVKLVPRLTHQDKINRYV